MAGRVYDTTLLFTQEETGDHGWEETVYNRRVITTTLRTHFQPCVLFCCCYCFHWAVVDVCDPPPLMLLCLSKPRDCNSSLIRRQEAMIIPQEGEVGPEGTAVVQRGGGEGA